MKYPELRVARQHRGGVLPARAPGSPSIRTRRSTTRAGRPLLGGAAGDGDLGRGDPRRGRGRPLLAIPRPRNYLGDVIIARRDKIGLTWLTDVNPLVDFALAASGTLTFRNFAADTRRGPPAASLRRCSGRGSTTTPALATPDRRRAERRATLQAAGAGRPAGQRVRRGAQSRPRSPPASRRGPSRSVRFRRGEAGWTLVGAGGA